MVSHKSKIALVCVLLGGLVIFCAKKLQNWSRDRQILMELCEQTKFTHTESGWSKQIAHSRSIFQSPESLRDSLLREDLSNLEAIVREFDAARDAHNKKIQELGLNPPKEALNRLEMLFSTGICERLTISQQAVWQEVSLLRNWQPGLSALEVRERVKYFDSKGLEVFASSVLSKHSVQ